LIRHQSRVPNFHKPSDGKASEEDGLLKRSTFSIDFGKFS